MWTRLPRSHRRVIQARGATAPRPRLLSPRHRLTDHNELLSTHLEGRALDQLADGVMAALDGERIELQGGTGKVVQDGR